jgi:biopolymer transport protein ExbB
VFAIIEAAGWPIWSLIVASIIALAIIGERTWSLRQKVVMPKDLLVRVVQEYRQNGVTSQMLMRLATGSPLGQIFSAGLRNVKNPPAIMKEAIEESGHAVAVELERFLTSLGTIAAIAPLLGLFGTVIGMIEIFGAQAPQGSNPLQMGSRARAYPGIHPMRQSTR